LWATPSLRSTHPHQSALCDAIASDGRHIHWPSGLPAFHLFASRTCPLPHQSTASVPRLLRPPFLRDHGDNGFFKELRPYRGRWPCRNLHESSHSHGISAATVNNELSSRKHESRRSGKAPPSAPSGMTRRMQPVSRKMEAERCLPQEERKDRGIVAFSGINELTSRAIKRAGRRSTCLRIEGRLFPQGFRQKRPVLFMREFAGHPCTKGRVRSISCRESGRLLKRTLTSAKGGVSARNQSV
jgi:hypothetical protein